MDIFSLFRKRNTEPQEHQDGNKGARITIEKLKIFEKFEVNGLDIDRASTKTKKKFPYEDYMFIDRLVQDVKMIEKGLAAKSYEEQVNNQLIENCDGENTIKYLKNLAAKL